VHKPGEHQVGVEERHLSAGRHRHRTGACCRRAHADRDLLSRARARPGCAQTEDRRRGSVDDAIGARVNTGPG
jgi:hypothetical protein